MASTGPLAPNAALAMQQLIESRIDHFESRIKELHSLFDSTPVESYDSVIPNYVQSILIDLAEEFTTCAKTRLGVSRIPYQLSIIDSHISYLRDLRYCLSTYLQADR